MLLGFPFYPLVHRLVLPASHLEIAGKLVSHIRAPTKCAETFYQSMLWLYLPKECLMFLKEIMSLGQPCKENLGLITKLLLYPKLITSSKYTWWNWGNSFSQHWVFLDKTIDCIIKILGPYRHLNFLKGIFENEVRV